MLLCACASVMVDGDALSVPDTDGTITVSMTYAERFGLPTGVRYEVSLIEAQDSDETVLATASNITDGEQPPLTIVLLYEAARIDRRLSYRLDGTITFRNEQLFSGELKLTHPFPERVTLRLQRIR